MCGTPVCAVPAGNSAVTIYFLPIALIASVVGIASTFAGSHHVRVWRTDTLSAAASASLIAWLLTILAMGYVRIKLLLLIAD
jgi:hypothetical protein